MASFYVNSGSRDLAEAIAAASGGEVIDRPLSRAVEVHGSRLVVTREMVRAHLKATLDQEEPPDALAALERGTWEMLKRNASGKLTETPTTLTVEGLTESGEEPKRRGCLGMLATFCLVLSFTVLVLVHLGFK